VFSATFGQAAGGEEGPQAYNLYVARGESVAEAVEGFMRRLGLRRNEALLGALMQAASEALRNAHAERRLNGG
jgi:hypothetical protein